MTLAFCLMLSAPVLAVENDNSLANLAERIGKRLQNFGIGSVAILEFPYLDGKPSTGPAIVQAELIGNLSQNRRFIVFEKARADAAAKDLGLEPGAQAKPDLDLMIAKKLGAEAAITGTLKDIKGKNKVEIQAFIRMATGGKIVGGESQIADKSWQDPVTDCGKIQYVSLSTMTPSPQASPNNVTFTFADPWWPTQTLGRISWNYCGPGAKAPNINDALPELRKKAQEAGGRHLIIEKSDLDPDNPKVLKVQARVVY